MNTKIILSALIALTLASCGCGSDSGGDAAGLNDCRQTGTTASCSVTGKGFTEDCTVFFGMTPVPSTFHPEDETIEFPIPLAAPGKRDISFQCGDNDPEIISKDFSVERTVSGTPVTPGHDAGASPVHPDPTPPPPAAPPAPPPPPPPPAAPSPAPAELKVTLSSVGPTDRSPGFDNILGLIRIDWEITGGGNLRDAYIYGPFNRVWGGEDCSKNLAVDPSGGPLVEGSDNYRRYASYFSGEICDATNCADFTPNPHVMPTHCRINLHGTGGQFYTRMLQKEFKSVLVGTAEDGTQKTSEKDFTAPDPVIQSATVGLSNSAPEFRVEVHYANAAARPFVAGCETSEAAPSLPSADGTGSFSLEHCKLLKKNFPIWIRVYGIGSNHDVAKNFRIRLGDVVPTLSAGEIDCREDHRLAGIPPQDCAGTLPLSWEARRPYEIKDLTAGEVSQAMDPGVTVPWVKSVRLLFGFHMPQLCVHGTPVDLQPRCDRLWDPIGEERVINTEDDLGTPFSVTKDHDRTAWKLQVTDFDGHHFESILGSRYTPGFTVEDTGLEVRNSCNGGRTWSVTAHATINVSHVKSPLRFLCDRGWTISNQLISDPVDGYMSNPVTATLQAKGGNGHSNLRLGCDLYGTTGGEELKIGRVTWTQFGSAPSAKCEGLKGTSRCNWATIAVGCGWAW